MCPSHSSLLPPRVAIGIDDAVPKNVEYFVKLIALRIVGEVKVEHLVGTLRAASKQDVHPAKPWASEHEGVIKLLRHGSHVVEEAMAASDHHREHTGHRPVNKDLAGTLSRAAKEEGNKESGKYC
ncbi:uncharacterized protein A4U43_C03F1490 [Asparagus officinalis]|uniref:Uncharacterized protein n=1 Tax=Asparagus officinalis TaxID=4686 RepID=A0A5P1F897_ASPOF|nr:uncharacterized protein A4U43_C03F1490 [Asparagus officinalis]